MAARVTPTEVRVLRPTTIAAVSDADLTIIIQPATTLVDRIEAADTASDLSAANLKDIERWLGAHFLSASRNPKAKSEGVEGLTETVEGTWGKGLEQTSYGTQAIAMDTTGTLQAIIDGVSGVATLDVD